MDDQARFGSIWFGRLCRVGAWRDDRTPIRPPSLDGGMTKDGGLMVNSARRTNGDVS